MAMNKMPATQCTGNTAPDGIIRGLFPLDPSIELWIRRYVKPYDVVINQYPEIRCTSSYTYREPMLDQYIDLI